MQGRQVKVGVQPARIAAMNQLIPLGRGTEALGDGDPTVRSEAQRALEQIDR